MKKIFFMIILLMGIVNAELHYERTEYGFSEICDYYTIIPSKDMIASTPKIVRRNIIHGKILDDRWEYLIEKEKEVEIPHYKTKCEIIKKWSENESKYKFVNECYKYLDYIEYKTIKIPVWEKHKTWKFKLGKPVTVKYCAKVKREYVPDRGWTIEVDNIPYFNKVEYPEYVWWNSSYTYKRPINCSNMNDKFPIVINGSGGFNLGCGKQDLLLWNGNRIILQQLF